MKSCKRHKCQNKCCDVSTSFVFHKNTAYNFHTYIFIISIFINAYSNKIYCFKFGILNRESIFQMEFHICDEVCGKKLSCGLHRCEMPCHKGRCNKCLESSFEELTCHCGEEVIYPPVPCNTPPPICNRPCNRMHACQHAG